jgi:hypothetical protein
VQFNSVTEPTPKLVVEPRHCRTPASTRSCAQPVYVGTISTTEIYLHINRGQLDQAVIGDPLNRA